MNNSIVARAVGASKAQSLQWFRPLAIGAMSPKDYLDWLSKETAISQEGRAYSAVFAANGAAPYAVSEITKGLWAAQKVGALGYAHAVGAAKRFQQTVEAITHSLSAQVGCAVPEVSAALVRIRVSHEGGGETHASFKDQVAETVEYYRQQLVAGVITRSDFDLVQRELKRQLREQEISAFMGQVEMGDDDSGNPSEDEGNLEVALHSPTDLWNYEPRDVAGAEGHMVRALHTYKKVELPLDDPDWGYLLDRVAESLAISVEYAKPEEKQAVREKAEIRMAVAEQGLMANPWKARWAVNYLARRIWRDRQIVTGTVARWEESIARIEEVMAREEKYNLPAKMTRLMTERPIESDEERSYYLVWEVVPEHEVQADSIHYTDRAGNVLNLMQGEYRIEVYQNLIVRANKLLEKMGGLYDKVRAVEGQLLPIWQQLAREPMPAQPPLYWNQRGFYLTEAEAKAALEVEQAAMQEQKREAMVEGAHAHLQALLAAQGLV